MHKPTSMLGPASGLPVVAEAVGEEVVLGCSSVALQVSGELLQGKDLPFRKPVKIGKYRDSLLPAVTDPLQRVEDQAVVLALRRFEQLLGGLSSPTACGRQLRAVALDVNGVRPSEPSPNTGQFGLSPDGKPSIPQVPL